MIYNKFLQGIYAEIFWEVYPFWHIDDKTSWFYDIVKDKPYHLFFKRDGTNPFINCYWTPYVMDFFTSTFKDVPHFDMIYLIKDVDDTIPLHNWKITPNKAVYKFSEDSLLVYKFTPALGRDMWQCTANENYTVPTN